MELSTKPTLDILESYEGTPTLQDRHFIDFVSMVVTLGRFFGDMCANDNTDPPATAALTTYFCNSFDRDLFNRYCTRNFPNIQNELKDAFSTVLKSPMSSGGVTKVPSSRKNTTTPKLHSEKATQTPVHSNTSPKNDWTRMKDNESQQYDWSTATQNPYETENIAPNNDIHTTETNNTPIYKPSPIRYARQYVDNNMAKPSFVSHPNTFEPVPNHPQFPVRLRNEADDSSNEGRTLRSPRYYTNKYGHQKPEVLR